MTTDFLSIVEAAYSPTEDVDEWLKNVLQTTRAYIGSSPLAFRFHHAPDGFSLRGLVGTGGGQAFVPALEGMVKGLIASNVMGPAFWRTIFPLAPTVGWNKQLAQRDWTATDSVHDVFSGLPGEAQSLLAATRDAFSVVGGDPSGHGCVISSMEPRVNRVPGQTTGLWQRVAAHLATGYRLARARAAEPDAVLDPGGKLVHREGDVGAGDAEALSVGTRAIDQARSKLRRADPDRALSIWKGLIAGRWSLVDHFDHDGRRFVVAKRNSIGHRPWDTLTPREAQIVACVAEGQAPKIIAYQLGVSVATVSLDLARARSRVGVSSLVELVAAYRARDDRPIAAVAR